VWSEADGWTAIASPFPTCGETESGAAFDLTADGARAVGYFWDGCASGQAFVSDGAGADLLDRVGVPGFERATVISADGSVIGGFAPVQVGEFFVDRSPAVWHPDGTGFLLDGTTANPGEITAASADGSVLAGLWAHETDGITGFTWTEAGGVTRFTTTSEGKAFESIFTTDISGDGSVVVGTLAVFDPDQLTTTTHGFVRDPVNGLRPISELASANGIEIPDDMRLTTVASVSADGTIFLGEAQTGDPAQGNVTVAVYTLVLPER
jgi:hypothetical protein